MRNVTLPLSSQRGITLLEMISVLLIMACLLTLATLGFKDMKNKADIDAETREFYADLVKVRSDALFQKVDRSVTLGAGNTLSVYATSDGTGNVIWERTYNTNHTITTNSSDPVAFDSDGVVSADRVFCVGTAGNGAGVDSVVLSSTTIQLGKLNGGACSSANIDPK